MSTAKQILNKHKQLYKTGSKQEALLAQTLIPTPDMLDEFEAVVISQSKVDGVFRVVVDGIPVAIHVRTDHTNIEQRYEALTFIKEGVKVRATGLVNEMTVSRGELVLQCTEISIVSLPEVSRPVGLPVTFNTNITFVEGDVIRSDSSQHGKSMTLNKATARILNNTIKASPETAGGVVVAFADRSGDITVDNPAPNAKVPLAVKSISGEIYSSSNLYTMFSDTYRTLPDLQAEGADKDYVRMVNGIPKQDENIVASWKPCIDILYKDYLEKVIASTQKQMEELVGKLGEYNTQYKLLTQYKEMCATESKQ